MKEQLLQEWQILHSKSTGVQIIGIDPEKEKQVFTLYNKIMPGTGDYFEKDSKLNLALIGQELAKDLEYYQVFC